MFKCFIKMLNYIIRWRVKLCSSSFLYAHGYTGIANSSSIQQMDKTYSIQESLSDPIRKQQYQLQLNTAIFFIGFVSASLLIARY